MGIAPITNLIPLTQTRTVKTNLEPVPMERVENSARTGDETYTPSKGKSSRGADDDSEDELTEEATEESSPEPGSTSVPGPVSFFA